ncbi:SRPBCC family protein [Amycolatopsis minnesotensis]|uniref:Alkylation response protein AidB-like acyl-CoA dehydrogenase n=1 Tax=Amycolatopsis minnesotensis TaxID=337894 RepID=A0ABN2RQR7_9PSEU
MEARDVVAAGTRRVPAAAERAWRLLADPLHWPRVLRFPSRVDLRVRTGERGEFGFSLGDGTVTAVEVRWRHAERRVRVVVSGAEVLTCAVRESGEGTQLVWECAAHELANALADALAAAAWPVAEAVEPAADPVSAARKLAPVLERRAGERDDANALPGDVVDLLRGHGLFRMGLPSALGGAPASGATVLAAVEELSRADPATGWTALIGNQSAYLAWLAREDAERLAGTDGAVVTAGSTAIRGTGVREGDTYVLTGRWAFNSGCLHADLLMGGFHDPVDGTARLAFFPASSATVHGTWHVAGLRASGSHDVEVSGLVVPSAHTAALYSAPAAFGEALHRLTPYTIQAVLMLGFPIGVARRALDESLAVADTGAHVDAFARAETELAAARELAGAAVGDLLACVEAGGDGTPRQAALPALALRHAVDTAKRVVTTAVRLGGAAAAEGSALHRCFTDIHAAGQHIAVSDDMIRTYAERYFGLKTAPSR